MFLQNITQDVILYNTVQSNFKHKSMARIQSFGKYELRHRIKFIWTPFQNEQLFAKPDDREEALDMTNTHLGFSDKKIAKKMSWLVTPQ